MIVSDAEDAEVVNEISVAVLSQALESLIIACEQLNPRISTHLRTALLAGARRNLESIREAYPIEKLSDQSLIMLDEYLRFIIETYSEDTGLSSGWAH